MDSNQRRRIDDGNSSNRRYEMANRRETRFLDLPIDLLHENLLHVSSSFTDLIRARASSPLLRTVADDDFFLREVDLFFMEPPDRWLNPQIPDDVMTVYQLTCQHRGNPSALLLVGCSEFFVYGNLEVGITLIRESAIRGYDLGIYVYSNLKRIMAPDVNIDCSLTNPNRDFMNHMKLKLDRVEHRYWRDPPLPQLYLDRSRSLDIGIIRRCKCARDNGWFRLWELEVKGSEMCDLCFYTIHALAFTMNFHHKIKSWPQRYNF